MLTPIKGREISADPIKGGRNKCLPLKEEGEYFELSPPPIPSLIKGEGIINASPLKGREK